LTDKEPLKILSLGAGVQSTAILLMSDGRELEKIDYAIFADTGWESNATYKHLEWLENTVSIPIIMVTAGNIRDREIESTVRGRNKSFITIPYFTTDGKSKGMLPKRCSIDFKVFPVQRKIRELAKHHKVGFSHGSVELWMGFSWDERQRMKLSQTKYITKYQPLIEKEITRYDCLQWMKSNGFPEPPRSSCLGCPFQTNAEWQMTKQDADEWKDVVGFDKHMRDRGGDRGQLFLHQTLNPIDEIDFRNSEDLGQLNLASQCEACFT